jgi:type IV pilus assembly protein PilA
MKSLHSRKGGFTLIELMIVVAIIGILAAIAIPNFVRFQLRAKSSEGKMNLAAIRTSEEGYFAEFGTYVAAGISPATLNAPPSQKQDFVNTDGAGLGFDQMGWAPEGQVYFRYAVVLAGAGSNDYTADAEADIDASAPVQVWGYAKTNLAVPLLDGTLGCAVALLAGPNQVGPCDPSYGQSVF